MKEALTFPQELTSLSLKQAAEMAPAIMATQPASYINLKRYNFVPTTEIIENMNKLGWVLTDAKQSNTKSNLRENFGVHVIKFQNPQLYVKNSEGLIEARPTVVFINSHDGTRPVQSELGIFRLVCSNGLIVKTQDFGGFRERHTRLNLDSVKQLLDEKTALMTNTIDKMNRWAGIPMKSIDMRKFATDALLLRLGEDRQPEDHEIFSILEAKRDADNGNNLWKVFNRVQENLVKGGFQLGERTARAITNPIADLKLNGDLWELAEQYEATAS